MPETPPPSPPPKKRPKSKPSPEELARDPAPLDTRRREAYGEALRWQGAHSMSRCPWTRGRVMIGGGAAGINALKAATRAGARVALVDTGPLGGTCVNRG
jgi:hypothetical protein